MHALKNKLFACLACTIILFSCSQDVDQLPEVINSKNTQATIDQFPGLGDFITGYVGNKKDKIENYAELNSGGIHPLIERIDFDRVMARLDESGQTYMAMSIRNDDPLVIQNLVVGKGIDGNYQKPMIFTYTMTEAFYQTYLSTGSLEGFEGTVHRVYLDPDQIRQNENVANLAMNSSGSTSCEDQSGLGSRDQDPNTSPDENPNPGGGGGSSGAGCSYELQTVTEIVYEFHCWQTTENGLPTTICESLPIEKEFDKMVMTCDDDWASLSSSDNNCTNPEDGEIPINDLDPPCPGDPLKNPKIAPTGEQGVEGGRFGALRINENGGIGSHNGLDIAAEENEALYTMVDGVVVAAKGGISANTRGGRDFGNYVVIKTQIDGVDYWNLYAHLNSVSAKEGFLISKGDFIGLSGKTGNASDESNPTPVTSHVHVEFRLFEDGISFNKSEAVNPEIFLATKFDTAGVPSNNPCN